MVPFLILAKELLHKCCYELRKMIENKTHGPTKKYKKNFSLNSHYCAALYKYAKCLAVQFKEYSTFVSTDDKCKIKCGEPNFPITAVICGKQVLIERGTVCRTADHDMSCITLVPTVVLTNDISDNVDKSCYRGIPHVYLKITGT